MSIKRHKHFDLDFCQLGELASVVMGAASSNVLPAEVLHMCFSTNAAALCEQSWSNPSALGTPTSTVEHLQQPARQEAHGHHHCHSHWVFILAMSSKGK
jgi:hypothetical protein